MAVLGATVRFAPVALAQERTAAPAEGTIEIELDGVRLRVDAAVDEQALKRVLRALGR